MSRKQELSKLSFFVSSTYRDLKQYRNHVINAIKSEKGKINAQEFFGARSNKPLSTCLDEVKKSDVFILIIAHWYGSIDPESGKSYTELEYEIALQEEKTIFAYIIAPDHPWNPNFIDKNESFKKQANFIQKLQEQFTVDFFTTQDDLAAKVIRDLYRELPKTKFRIGKLSKERDIEDTLEILKKFYLLPKIYSSQEVEIECKLEPPKEVSKEECEAFYLDYGAALKRKVRPTNEEVKKFLEYQEIFVYGDLSVAEELLNLSSNYSHRIQVKLKFGSYCKETFREKVMDASDFREENYLSISTQIFTVPQKKKIVTEYIDEPIYLKGLIFIGLS